MFVIRRAKPDDVSTLLKLARMVHFINLPPDKEIIDSKINWSRNCFLMAADADLHETRAMAQKHRQRPHHGELSTGLKDLAGRSPLFMFVMEELETQGVVGTCQVISKMGGPGAPNVSLQLSRKEMFSQSLAMGVTHTVAKIHLDESSPTEIGGLILQPSFRGHRLKLGRFLAQVRFHFIGLHRELFSDRVLAEMMGPITVDGHNPFWDFCTRCFINLTYDEADRFCQQTKEFLLSLFPREEIYLTLLAPEARSVVGQVGPETVPAKRMLEQLGFRYFNRIDPFDGGPHLECATDEISLVKATDRSTLGSPVKAEETGVLDKHGIVSVLKDDGDFRAVETDYGVDAKGRIVLERSVMAALEGEAGSECGFTPLSRPETWPMRTTTVSRGKPATAGAGSNGTHAAGGGKKKVKKAGR
ncbi:MAG: arginine N-succinyltransferase [Planctomycetaceae bacterium]|jgi:arginine N-succinyltransferase|nr:arginine N-succinyltransferase [Phycisphaerales bacterium]MCE2653950.1 arginine N-succinyltransferase [Planctomycetaceae bacterium]